MIPVKKVEFWTFSAILRAGGESFKYQTIDPSKWLIFIVRYTDKVQFFTPWDGDGNYITGVVAEYSSVNDNKSILAIHGFELIENNSNSAKEFNCSICSRKNDIGVSKCWFCENNFV